MSFKVTVQPSGHEFTVKAGQTVLDAALESGLILPYSCRTGTCSTCRGRIVQGSYDAGAAPGRILGADEISQGHTLLCQARPESDLLVEAHEVRMADSIVVRKMPARVLSLRPLADDVMEITLQLPAAQPFNYQPGQYLDIFLKDGRRRSYSMASGRVRDHKVQLHVRHMPGGAFTDRVFASSDDPLKEREIIRIEGPFGSFFLRSETDLPLVFLGSGTGFAPIKAMIEGMIEAGEHREVTFYWGGRRPHDLYQQDVVKSLQAQLPGLQFVPVVSDARPEDSWQGRQGLVHQAVMQDYPDLSGHQVYVCGNPAMVHAAYQDFIHKCSLPAGRFHADAFTSEADLALASL